MPVIITNTVLSLPGYSPDSRHQIPQNIDFATGDSTDIAQIQAYLAETPTTELSFTQPLTVQPVYYRPFIMDVLESGRMDKFLGYICPLPEYTTPEELWELYGWMCYTYQNAEINNEGLFTETNRRIIVDSVSRYESIKDFMLRLHRVIYPNSESFNPMQCWKNIKSGLANKSILLILGGLEHLSALDMADLIQTTGKLGDDSSVRFWVKQGYGYPSQTELL